MVHMQDLDSVLYHQLHSNPACARGPVLLPVIEVGITTLDLDHAETIAADRILLTPTANGRWMGKLQGARDDQHLMAIGCESSRKSTGGEFGTSHLFRWPAMHGEGDSHEESSSLESN